MNDQLERAKALFMEYCGSLPDMHRGGRYAEYKTYGVDIATEKLWCKEMVEQLSGELSIRDWEAVSSLSSVSKHYQDSRIVENVISFAARNMMSADSVVRLMFAEHLLDIIRLHKKEISQELLLRACKSAAELLEAIIAQPLIVDPGHELAQLKLKDKRGLNQRAKQDMESIEEILN
ncbi:hypothetical protein [Paenibacillus agri]|uniref:Uncharacterized protein n=1 Tax=Paenibacillus agri TaxID=2744309 RepID=A0A850EPU4_9BACL|nr:hypothetical protein [Paenibacillus agri]NUU62496.1 hypothetical protein [Paenibacillus agri]